MTKLTLHHFHKMEIEKQQQNIINGGGIDYCVCTGTLCSCYCGGENSGKQSDLADNMSDRNSNGANKSAENTLEQKTGGGPA